MQLFLVVNLLVVLIASGLGVVSWSTESQAHDVTPWLHEIAQQAERQDRTIDQHLEVFHTRAAHVARATVGVTISLATLLSLLLLWRRRIRVGVHLVFATHLVSFFLLVPDLLFSGLLSPFLYELGRTASGSQDGGVTLVRLLSPVAPLLVWWILALKTAFGLPRSAAIWKGIVGALLFFFGGAILHQWTVFRVTLYLLEK